MIKSKHSKLSSKILIVLLVFSLVTSPFQMILSASTEENEQIETDADEETEDSTENQVDEVIEESSTEEVSEEDADPVEVEVTDEEVAPSNIDENVEEESLAPEDLVEGNKASEEETDSDEDMMDETTVKKTTSNEYMIDDFAYYDDYHISIEDTYSLNGNSITITWSTSYDIGQDFDLSINGVHYATVPSITNTYTFTDLKAYPDYEIKISTSIEKDDNVFNFQEVEWFTPDWEDEDFVPVNFITTGDNLTTNEHLRIRGMDEGNALFYEDFNLSYHNSEFYLPIGELEFTIYDINDPSTATTETIEIKESIDYLNNPIQLKINLSEMIKEAEPFSYELAGVTEDSITLKWNHVSKISGFKIVAYERDNYFNGMFHSESNFIPNNTNEYTFTGLDPDKIYSIDLIAIYKNNLELEDSFLVKTNGEDSKDKAINFGDEKLHKEIANMLGIHFRDVTEADLEEINTFYFYPEDIETLSGLQFAHNLKSLNVPNNKISNIESLANLVYLNYLNLRNNNITDITALENLSNIIELDLSFNKIKYVDALAEINNLETLSLNENQITDISALQNLKKLTDLSLASNNINKIDALANLSNLEWLYLYNNEIEGIPSLEQLQNLYDLNLSTNKITNIKGLESLDNLGSLDLSINQIKDISSLKGLSNLFSLNLDANEISDVSALASLPNLEFLSLADNKLENISKLESLINLGALNLHFNQISDITPLVGLKSLEELSLDNNEIVAIPNFDQLTNLWHLSISNNKLSDISGLAGMDNLRMLILQNNKITDISPLVELENISYLDLSDNNITDITPLKEMPQLQVVYLKGMDITDTDTIQYLINKGAAVYYDNDTDTEDSEDVDDESNDQEESTIDREEVLKQFSEEQGFSVSNDGKTIELNLAKQSNKNSIELTTDQTKTLIENKQTINLQKDEVQASIPASTFDNYDKPVTININKVESDPNSLSDTYDFTIKQGTRTISEFKEGITLTFKVDPDRAENTDNLKVFYFNEETNEWEKIGGAYSNGTVTALTTHFSKFTVFEEIVNDEPPVNGDEPTPGNNDDDQLTDDLEDPTNNTEVDGSESNVENDDTQTTSNGSDNDSTTDQTDSENAAEEDSNEKESDSQESNQLPDTATSLYNILAIGVLLIATALTLYIYNRRKTANQ